LPLKAAPSGPTALHFCHAWSFAGFAPVSFHLVTALLDEIVRIMRLH